LVSKKIRELKSKEIREFSLFICGNVLDGKGHFFLRLFHPEIDFSNNRFFVENLEFNSLQINFVIFVLI
jgi:hypothetical protein